MAELRFIIKNKRFSKITCLKTTKSIKHKNKMIYYT